MTTGPRFLRTSAVAFAFLLLLALTSVAQAADNTYTVDTTDDSAIATAGSTTCADALDGKCSLRAAIDASNNNPGNDTIVVPAGRYDRTLGDTGEDNSLGDFNVANNGTLTIQGQTGDPKDVIISADGLDRVIEIDAGGTLTATGVTFQDGFTGGRGAGILVNGGTVVPPPGAAAPTDVTTLTLNRSRVLKNVTIDSCGGGIWGTQSATSIITLNSSNVDNNNARECGGGIGYEGPGSILKMFDSTVDGNTASVFEGGGIWDGADPNNPQPLSPTRSAALTTANETLHIERSSVSNNQAPDDSGGGIYNHFCDCGSDLGDVNITDSHIDHNFSAFNGGGVYNDAGFLNASHTTFNNNSSHDGPGGGIWSDGDGVSLADSNVEGNFAYDDGGGVCNGFGPLTVDGSVVAHNTSRQRDGGGLSNSEGCFSDSVNSAAKVAQVGSDALTITRSHIDGNFAGNFGGGVNNDQGDLTIEKSTVNENEARRDKGGGVYNDGNDVEITDSHVDQNKADLAQGGGVANDDGSLTIIRTSVDSNASGTNGTCCGRGGGVYSNGTAKVLSPIRQPDGFVGTHIIDSSISKNHAFSSGGGLWDNTGADIINTTIANNVADVEQTENDHQGGGIFDHGEGMTLTNVTLAGNIVNDGEGGGIWANSVDPTFTNTIIADNEANFDPSTSDCGGSSYTSNGHNLDGFQSSGAPDQCGLSDGTNGDQAGKHAKLGPLQDNGGPTLTRALLDGSPAIDTGDNSVCANLTTSDNTDPHDQRQAHRPAGAACDIGAYEANSLADLSITKDASPNPAVVGSNVTYTIHATNNGPDSLLGGVTVTDTLPASVSFVSAAPSQGSCSGTTTVTCNLGGLAAGATATVTIVVKTNATGTLSNTAAVSGAPTDPNGSNNSATAQSSVISVAAAASLPPAVLAQIQACTQTPPRTSISLNGLIAAADTLRFVGRSIDLRCLSTTQLGIKNVQIAVAFIVGSNTTGATAAAKKCRFLNKNGKLGKARSCKKPKFLRKARRGKLRNGKVPWTFRMRHLHLPPGRYLVIALGTDSAGHSEKKLRKYNQKTFTIKP